MDMYAVHLGGVINGGLRTHFYREEQYKDSIRRGLQIGKTAKQYDEDVREAARRGNVSVLRPA